MRLTLDALHAFTAGYVTRTPRFEAGLRHDAGDAEEGVGFELGAGLAYRGAGVTLEGKARTLLSHDDSAYEEWGASLALRVDPGEHGRGLSLSIAPTWGAAASEAEQLWSTRAAADLVGHTGFEANRHLNAEVGYGLGLTQGRGLLTPYAALTLSNGDSKTLGTGVRWNASQAATLALEGVREFASDQPASSALTLRAAMRF